MNHSATLPRTKQHHDAQHHDAQEQARQRAIRAIKLGLFAASVAPALLAGAYAHYLGRFAALDFLLLTSAVLLAQAGGDYLYYDFTHRVSGGRDTHTKIFAGWRPLFVGRWIRGRGIVAAGAVCLLLDLGIALYYVSAHGPVILLLAAMGGLIAVLFTPLMLRGLKEPVIFLAFGPLTVSGMVLVLTGAFRWEALAVSLPVAFLVTLLAHLKSAHFDLAEDDASQVVVRLSRGTLIALNTLAYLSLVALVALRLLPPQALLGALTLPLSLIVLRVANRPRGPLQAYLWAVAQSTLVLLLTGGGVALGLLLHGAM